MKGVNIAEVCCNQNLDEEICVTLLQIFLVTMPYNTAYNSLKQIKKSMSKKAFFERTKK